MSTRSIKEFFEAVRKICPTLYSKGEVDSIAHQIVEHLTGKNRVEQLLNPDVEAEVDSAKTQAVFEDVKNGRPLQYIVGSQEFMGFTFDVQEGVLIPRPETEELVSLTVKKADEGARVLDVGTGSGAIAISLAKMIKGAKVTAVDISADALEIAQKNAIKNSAQVEFIQGDALKGVENYVDHEFDIIVSNPPYIPASEQATMRDNVTLFEPHLALFVPDHEPLIFYERIAKSAFKLLRPGGILLFEIHEDFAQQTKELIEDIGFQSAEIKLDINDKARIVWSMKSL